MKSAKITLILFHGKDVINQMENLIKEYSEGKGIPLLNMIVFHRKD